MSSCSCVCTSNLSAVTIQRTGVQCPWCKTAETILSDGNSTELSQTSIRSTLPAEIQLVANKGSKTTAYLFACMTDACKCHNNSSSAQTCSCLDKSSTRHLQEILSALRFMQMAASLAMDGIISSKLAGVKWNRARTESSAVKFCSMACGAMAVALASSGWLSLGIMSASESTCVSTTPAGAEACNGCTSVGHGSRSSGWNGTSGIGWSMAGAWNPGLIMTTAWWSFNRASWDNAWPSQSQTWTSKIGRWSKSHSASISCLTVLCGWCTKVQEAPAWSEMSNRHLLSTSVAAWLEDEPITLGMVGKNSLLCCMTSCFKVPKECFGSSGTSLVKSFCTCATNAAATHVAWNGLASCPMAHKLSLASVLHACIGGTPLWMATSTACRCLYFTWLPRPGICTSWAKRPRDCNV